jgi:lipoprotein-anchoring transpeptidase ErfK/SrfK
MFSRSDRLRRYCSKALTPGTLRSYFRLPLALLGAARAWGSSARESGEALLIRRQIGLRRGVKEILVTGITVTTLLTCVATASAQNIFQALFGGLAAPPPPVPDANFTARDRQQLANPPYRQAWIAPAYRRQIVHYHRKEAPGTILVDTDARYVYYVLPERKAVRYGAIVGEKGWSGVATVGRKEEWPGWTPTEGEKRRLGPLPNYVEGGAANPMGARALYLYANGQDTLYRIHGTNQPGWIGHAISSGCIRLTNEDVIDLYSRVKTGATVVVLGPNQGASRLASASAQ